MTLAPSVVEVTPALTLTSAPVLTPSQTPLPTPTPTPKTDGHLRPYEYFSRPSP